MFQFFYEESSFSEKKNAMKYSMDAIKHNILKRSKNSLCQCKLYVKHSVKIKILMILNFHLTEYI